MTETIIPHTPGGKMGRIAPGTELAVRRATDEEIAYQWTQLHKARDERWDPTTTNPASKDYEPNPDYRLQPNVWLVVFAGDPEQVLHDWFSPVGHWLFEYAAKEARKYANARGATYVGPLMPRLWQDDADQA